MRIRTTTLTRVGAAFLASTLLVTGCADSGGDKDNDKDKSEKSSMSKDEIWAGGVYGADDGGTPKDGGTLTVGDYGEPRSLDPTVTIPNGAVGASAMAAIYDVLMRWDDEAGAYVPQLAESLTSDDNTTWRLTLRKGVKFSDGTPVDAAAVMGSIGYYMSNQGFNTLLLYTNLSEMKPVDATTIDFVMKAPWASFPAMLATGPGMIVAPKAIAGGKDKFKPIGAGPFVFEDYKPSEELVLTRNDDYFGERPHLDKLRFVWPASDQARMDSLKRGDIDQASVRTPGVVEEARTSGTAGALVPVGLGSMVWINNREGRPGADERLRKAMDLAFDPEAFLERTADGHGIASRNIYTPSAPYYTEVTTPETNIAEAKKLVEEAKADGVSTKLVYLGQSDQTSKTAAVTIQAMLEAAGFTVQVELLNNIADQTSRIYVTHDYDIASSSMSIPVDDPYSRFSSQLIGASPANPSGYSNPEMDKLIGSLQAATGEEATSILTQINELWQETVPGIAIAPGGFFFPWNENVHGILPSSEFLMLYHQAWKS
ncbi:ABC transporter substrate-binding protein [Nocardioides daejeonensis]|uniref:ABC transporter substrate-binding protein n=1 Tax=Nocardioides daejeonensis TaxID=1046556 RepID=UPI0013A58EEE|nr:ABC transporter substrate-binding protein [Nocardioides daejeonensis]